MQLFDSLTLLSLLIILAIKLFKKNNRPKWTSTLLFIALAFSLLQIMIEGFRWQMVAAESVLLILLLQFIWDIRFSKSVKKSGKWSSFRRISSATLLSLLMLTSILFSYLFPIFELPTPTGQFAVGTTEFHLIDENRLETYTKNPDDKRQLMVRAWYPAEPKASDKTTPYWRQAMVRSKELTKGVGMPSFLFSHLGQVSTHSFWDSPIANQETSYPVLIFSHGFAQGWASQNTHLMESLASHGYIIFGIDHAYVGMGSIFPDGKVASFSKETFKAMSQQPSKELIARFKEIEMTDDWHKQIKLLSAMNNDFFADAIPKMSEALQIWTADQRFVLSQIDMLQRGEKLIPSVNQVEFKGRLDTDNLGFFGMSFGGSTSLENCVKDIRCKAGVNMDGFMPEQVNLAGLNRPFMFMNSEHNLFFNAMYEVANDDVYSVSINGATHLNYLDFSIMSPMYQMMGILGPIDGVKMLTITDDYVRSFFDHYLKNKESPLLDNKNNKYPEVIFKKK